MPPAPKQPWTPTAVLFLAGIALGLLVLVYFIPEALLAIGGVILFLVMLNFLSNRQLRNVAEARPGESICTFARSFDRRHIDPWIIRAVWQELQVYVRGKYGEFPLRASDRIEDDYYIDWEDVGDVVETVALRTGRSMEAPEKNPYYNRVRTVGDLVHFVNHQPVLQGIFMASLCQGQNGP